MEDLTPLNPMRVSFPQRALDTVPYRRASSNRRCVTPRNIAMPHGRVTPHQIHSILVRVWTVRIACLGLLIISIAAASYLHPLPASFICVTSVLSMWHLSHYRAHSLDLLTMHAMVARRRRDRKDV